MRSRCPWPCLIGEEDAVVLDLLTGAEDLLRLDCPDLADHVPLRRCVYDGI